MIRTTDIAWLAGLLEGEGSFHCDGGRGSRLRETTGHLSITVQMTDEDVIKKIQQVTGFGTFRSPRQLPSGKTCYGWSVSNQTQAAGLMMTLLPLMGVRRAAKIRECLAEWKKKPIRASLQTHCVNGHPFTGENLRIVDDGKYVRRRCKQCVRDRQAKHRQKMRKQRVFIDA